MTGFDQTEPLFHHHMSLNVTLPVDIFFLIVSLTILFYCLVQVVPESNVKWPRICVKQHHSKKSRSLKRVRNLLHRVKVGKKMLKLQFSGYRSLSSGTRYGGNKERQRRNSPITRLPFSQAGREDEFQLRFNTLLMAMKESGGGMSGFAGKNWEPDMEIEVPFEQRPVNEYSSLKNSFLYSWAELNPGSFFLRLGVLWATNFVVIGAPISAASFDPSKDSLRFILAAGTGTLLLVSLVVLRIYLGWSYVGDRLLSAVIPYEESGWYDGQMWVKPPEVLARDRLLGSYKVKPVIKLLKQTLLGTGALLVTAISLLIFAAPIDDLVQSAFGSKGNSTELSTSKNKQNLRKEQLLKLPAEIKNDDDLAAAAAEAADGRPVYCRDRYYRALAGGQYCKWDDLIK